MSEALYDAPLTPLTDHFAISRRALDEAGGAAELNQRFAARLTETVRGTPHPFVVKHSEFSVTVQAPPEQEGFVIGFDCLDELERGETILYELETLGDGRRAPPAVAHAFHRRLAALIAAWPEVEAVIRTHRVWHVDNQATAVSERQVLPHDAWPPGYRSPLSAEFKVPYTAIALAGGVAAMNERFAARLGGYFRECGESFDTRHTDMMAVATGAADNNNGVMLMIIHEWTPARFRGEFATYRLEGVDAVRHIIAAPGCDHLARDDPFWVLFAAVRTLIFQWPEVVHE